MCPFARCRMLLVFSSLLLITVETFAQGSSFAITHVTVIDPASGKSL